MSDDPARIEDAVEALLEDFLDRRDAGEAMDVDAFVRSHPQHANELRLHLRMLDLAAAALRPAEQRADDVPQELGPYRIIRELGSGGMGRVFLAESGPGAAAEVGTQVAVKLVHPHLFRGAGFFKRFLREADLGRRVEHENVVRTLDADAVEVEGRHHHFIVMEYVEGQTLRELVEGLDRVPEELCRHVAREIARALGSVHAVGAIHRDLKPENVLITRDHVVKLMDLGVARLTDDQLKLSQTGAFVGSVHYAAPEQFGGKSTTLDGRTDLHALGTLLYELSTGRHPFDGDDVATVMRRVLDEQPRPAGELNPQLSPFFEGVMARLLEKEADSRFASAAELLDVLEKAESSEWWKEQAQRIRSQTCRPLRRIRIPRETAVYGREAELHRLQGLFECAKAGSGRVVLIEGEAGIGKSRLADEFVARLRQEGEELNFLFGSYPPGARSAAAGALVTAFREHFGDEGAAAYLRRTPLLVPAFDAALQGEPPPRDAPELTNDTLGTCFVHATRALASESVTVLLIEDLHFAPQAARDLFVAIALAIPEHRVLLIGTARPGLPEDRSANLTRLDHVERFELGRLGAKDLAELLRDSFQSERLAMDLAGRIGIKSDGNPFFVFEIIQGLREGQFISKRADGTWATTRLIDEIGIPSSVLDLVNARVATLDDGERNLLDVAACCGFEFDPLIVGDALGMARLPTLQSLAKIEKRDRLVRSAGRRFLFDHHQVQEALHEALPIPLREEYHLALAESLEQQLAVRGGASEDALTVEVCHHFLHSVSAERALTYLRLARAYLVANHLHAETAALLERAVSSPGVLTGTERAKALLWLASALHEGGSRTRQEECADEAESIAAEVDDAQLRWQAAMELGRVRLRTQRWGDAESAFLGALEIARSTNDRFAEAQAIGSLGSVAHSSGRLDEARRLNERALGLYRDLGKAQNVAGTLGNIGGVLRDQGRTADARRMVEQSVSLSRDLGDRKRESVGLVNLGNLCLDDARLMEAREHLERAVELSVEIGHRSVETASEFGLALVHGRLGHLDTARSRYARVLSLSHEIGDRQLEAIGEHNVAGVLLELGDPEGSEEHLLTAMRIGAEIQHHGLMAASHALRGRIRTAMGDLEQARASFQHACSAGVETLARCELALLPGGAPHEALAAFTDNRERLDAESHREVRLLLWKATTERVHLVAAKRWLDEALSKVPEEHHESMCRNLRVNREILAAWREEFGDGSAEDA